MTKYQTFPPATAAVQNTSARLNAMHANDCRVLHWKQRGGHKSECSMFKERTRRKVFLWAMLCCQPPLSLPLSSLSNMPSRARLDAYLVNNIPLSRPPFPTTESPFDNLSTAESNSDADNTSDKAVQYFSSDSFQGSFIDLLQHLPDF